MASLMKFNKYLRKKNNTNLIQTLPENKNGTFLNSYYEVHITLILKVDKDNTKKEKNYRPLYSINVDNTIINKKLED